MDESSLQGAPCSVCKMAASLYKCPRCLTQTCSLTCCKLHKERDRCSGKEDLLAHLRQSNSVLKSKIELEEGEEPPASSSSECSDDDTKGINSVEITARKPRIDEAETTLDARFLSHVQGHLTNKPITEVEFDHHQKRPTFTTTPRQRDILRVIQKGYTNGAYAVFLPPFFERAKMNRSRVVRNNIIAWTLEIVPGDIRHDILDDIRLSELLPNHSQIMEIKDENPGVYTPRWRQVSSNSTIREALSGVHIVEFPVFRACK